MLIQEKGALIDLLSLATLFLLMLCNPQALYADAQTLFIPHNIIELSLEQFQGKKLIRIPVAIRGPFSQQQGD
jgi:hypothetical protein